MIGIVIVTHNRLGDALIEAAESIRGAGQKALASVSVDLKEDADLLRKKIDGAIKSVSRNRGVIIMTDMYGGTPSNLGYSFLEENRVEVISGVNLPVLIKALDTREKSDLAQLGKSLETCGKRSISLGSGILKGAKRSA